MPTITFSKKDFEKLLDTTLTTERLQELFDYAKAELEKQEGDNISVKYNDTNQPYLWCPEGLALLLRGILGKDSGLPKLNLTKSDSTIIVDSSVKTVRPYIAGFIAHGPPLTEYMLKLLIQLQEKLCENYGRKREKIAIGLYPSDKITFPITYKAVKPDQASFIPLGFEKQANLAQILTNHPKGKEYSWILSNLNKYPLLIDAQKQVLSFPPIINSQFTGKLSTGDKNIFFEATGNDIKGVDICSIIFAYALSMRGYIIHSITVKSTKSRTTPTLQITQKPLNKQLIVKRLGLKLTDQEIIRCLTKFRYDYNGKKVTIPQYRNDIMHPYDIIEDIGIAYGYNNITSLDIHTHTRGAKLPGTSFINVLRDICVGLGYQEIFSPILTNMNLLYNNMLLEKQEIIEIDNYTSTNYSCVRTWILPILLSVLTQNRHAEAPYKIFEEGIVTVKNGKEYHDERHLSIVLSHANANFTEIKQATEYILNQLALPFIIKAEEHSSFIPGRCAAAYINNKKIAFFGEIHPAVLRNFGQDLPTVGMEINLSYIM